MIEHLFAIVAQRLYRPRRRSKAGCGSCFEGILHRKGIFSSLNASAPAPGMTATLSQFEGGSRHAR
ncbi:hypothetical protein GOZ84_20385 [Agrobacterium vitis]|uniref:Uncharacterized protein n=4 Tax=Rhizobium/Agrobacterium group TaxID=227290 RepID=Q8U5Y4_AGRFC|nr:conserved hypothetical protein [Agrobacterium fabrum str. C58]ASK41777.1 hypothetical protein [Agrobacterium tumefaciens]ASK43396.1 hypothetical protein [Agrobacterium fabrum]ASK43414.1 hypothetical protein [Agrobacterium radiobacter]ASK43934.1 hypothetical protein [Rhizobium rhizogenes]MVA53123.1 hypothetical protein [Agrobacterium vitis]